MSRRSRFAVLVPIALGFMVAFLPPRAIATGITVNTELDILPGGGGVFPPDGKCSLRAAILSSLANTNANIDGDCTPGLGGGVLDVINIDPSLTNKTLNLAASLGPLPLINNMADNAIQIIGPTTNAAQFAISGGGVRRIFELGFANTGHAYLTIANLTIKSGGAQTIASSPYFGVNGDGGAIFAGDDVHLTLDNVVVRDSSAVRGGGIFIQSGVLTSNGGAFVNNNAASKGGAIFAFNGPTTYNGYAVKYESNIAKFGGVLAMNADPGSAFAHIERALIIGNSASAGGAGGVFYAEPVLSPAENTTYFELTDSTVMNNSAPAGGVFFGVSTRQEFTFLRDTFKNNTSSVAGQGGLYSAGGGFIANSIIMSSTCDNNDGTRPTGVRNRMDAGLGGCNDVDLNNLGAITNIAGALAQNGGPNVQQTLALLSNSNALDQGAQAYCGTVDQRSVPRGVNGTGSINAPQVGDCDIGAYEYAKFVVNFVTGTSTAQESGVKNVQVKLSIPLAADSPLAAPLVIPITRAPASTAKASIDYTIPPAGVTFPAGSVNGTVVNLPITILPDNIAEANGEFVIFNLGTATGVAIAEPKVHNLSIQDNDIPGVTVVDGGSTTINESTPLTQDSFTWSMQSQPDYLPDPNNPAGHGPGADVSVDVSPDRDCTAVVDGQLATEGDPVTLLILNADWTDSHTLSVNAIDDPWDEDLRNESTTHYCRIKFTFSSADPVYDVTEDLHDVNVIDNDVNAVNITQSSGTTATVEGGATDTFEIVLATPPDPGKPLPGSPRADTVVTVDPDSQCNVGSGAGVAKDFAFNGSTWNTPQVVTVTAFDDLTVELLHTCLIVVTVNSGDPIYDDLSNAPAFARTPVNVTASIQDYDPGNGITNDPPFVDITDNGILVTEANNFANGDTFTVVLERQPKTNSVVVGLQGSTDPRIPGSQVLLGELGGAPPSIGVSLTFTPANWNVPKTVQVVAVNDDYDESANAYPVTISATITSTAVGFNDANLRRFRVNDGAPAATLSLPVTITDNDVSGIVISETNGSTLVTENGLQDTYWFTLASHPFADVTVTVDPDAQCNLGAGAGVAVTRFFPAGAWTMPNGVTITALNDLVVEGNHTCTITHVAESSDELYDELAGPSVVAAITENDLPRIGMFTGPPQNPYLVRSESAPTPAQLFAVALLAQPDADVTIHFTVTDGQTHLSLDGFEEGDFDVDLLFTPANYNTPQSVFVRPIDDDIYEPEPLANLAHIELGITTSATGFGTPQFTFNALPITEILVIIEDNDGPGVTLDVDNGVAVAEGGATDTYGLVLQSEPTANVTITTAVDAGCTATPSLTFTPANWDVPQYVTVTAIQDVVVEGTGPWHNCSFDNVATSEDASYDGIAIADVVALITDDDTPGVSITAANVALDEAATGTFITYSVVLDAQPTLHVDVLISIGDGQSSTSADGTAGSAQLTFEPETWDTPQLVSIWVVDDAVGEASPHAGLVGHVVFTSAIGWEDAPITVNAVGGYQVQLAIADNDNPTTSDDGATTNEDTSVAIDVLANDAGGVTDVETFDATTAEGGTVVAGPGDSLTYTPAPDFNGVDSFTYTATNGAPSTGFSTVTVTVNPVNDAPSFIGGDVVTAAGAGAYAAPWATDISAGPPDEAGQTVHFSLFQVSDALFFSVQPAVNGGGQLTFTVAPGKLGSVTVRFRAVDDGGTANGGDNISEIVEFTITVDNKPTLTLATGSSCNISSSIPTADVKLTVADTDDALANVLLQASTTNGTLLPLASITFSGTGAARNVRIAPVPGVSGTATIAIWATDGDNVSAARTWIVRVGTGGDNTMNGTSSNEIMFGMGGDDTLTGSGGNDLLCGGGSADDIDGGTGDDFLRGGTGNDDVSGGDGNDEVRGSDGVDVVSGGNGNDKLYGGAGNDQLFGNADADSLYGESGADKLTGGSGPDYFNGGPGVDTNLDYSAAAGDTKP